MVLRKKSRILGGKLGGLGGCEEKNEDFGVVRAKKGVGSSEVKRVDFCGVSRKKLEFMGTLRGKVGSRKSSEEKSGFWGSFVLKKSSFEVK